MPAARQVQVAGDASGNTVITGDGNVVIIQATSRLEAVAAPPAALGPNPYLGLTAFTEAERFFGREALTQRLWEAFWALHTPLPGQPVPLRLLPILGPSGCGKSSLVRAGLLPALARQPLPGLRTPRVAVLTPGAHPLEALANVLARIATQDPTPVAKSREFAEELRQTTTPGAYDGLRRIAESLPDIATSPLIVLIDQGEELYSLCDDEEARLIFVSNLLHAVADRAARVSVLLTLRSDFLGQTQRHAALNQAIAAAVVLVPAMDQEELRRAIAEPARQAGQPLDAATVELLMQETAGHEGALPLLQFALMRLWDGLAAGVAAAETHRRIGGVGGALAGEAERLYAPLSAADQAVVRRAFLGGVQLGEGTRDTRRRVPVAELVAHGEEPQHVRAVLHLFAHPDARLLTFAAAADGTDTVEITHEVLFEHWQTLRDWLAARRDDLRLHRRLTEAAGHWAAAHRPDGLLWRPPDLDLLQALQQRAGSDMTATEVAFWQASAGREQRTQRLKRLAVAALVGLTLAAAGAVYVVNQARQATAKERDRAQLAEQRAQRRFDDVRQLANAFMFKFHDAIEHLAGSTPARTLVIKTAREYLDKLSQEADEDRALQRDLYVSYNKIGDILAQSGDTTGALASYRQGLALREALAQADPHNSQAQHDLAVSYAKIGTILAQMPDRNAEALTSYRQALTIFEARATADPANAQARKDLDAIRKALAALQQRAPAQP